MTLRLVVILTMVCAIVAPTICESPAQQARSIHSSHPARQIIDTQSDTIANALTNAPTPIAMSQAEVETPLPAKFDLDLPQITIAFGTQDLDQLILNGTVTLPLPGSDPIQLKLVQHAQRHGIDQISAEHKSLISTVTRRGDKFFATIATPSASYRIDGGAQASYLYPHRELAMRTIYQTTDYRHAF